MKRKQKPLPPVHPGEILREDLLRPLNISLNRLARDLNVPVTRISEIARCRRSITADTALRLARYFGSSAQFWMNLQIRYDLEKARQERQSEIEKEVQPRQAA